MIDEQSPTGQPPNEVPSTPAETSNTAPPQVRFDHTSLAKPVSDDLKSNPAQTGDVTPPDVFEQIKQIPPASTLQDLAKRSGWRKPATPKPSTPSELQTQPTPPALKQPKAE